VKAAMTVRVRNKVDQDMWRRLNRARRFIDQHYCLPLNLDQIAQQACFSRFHFIRLFQQVFNKTPHQYLSERRVQRAKELLDASSLTVTEVCFEVGFESLGLSATARASSSLALCLPRRRLLPCQPVC
jgi:AraC-like DNA-binding protein